MSGKIVVVGASGYLGKPTVTALTKAMGAANISVVTRNPAAAATGELGATGATLIKGDFADVDSLKSAFTGAAIAYIITPGTEVRFCLFVFSTLLCVCTN